MFHKAKFGKKWEITNYFNGNLDYLCVVNVAEIFIDIVKYYLLQMHAK